jgi:TatD DNase family protein
MGKNKEIPKFGLPIVETHCHLDYLKLLPTEETLAKSAEHDVEKIITISVSPDNVKSVLAIANSYPNVFCSQGIHPHEAKLWTDEVEKDIRDGLVDDKAVAVGEIGLDFHYNNSPKEKQIEVFGRQLEIAVEFDLPIIVHSRDADEDMIETLGLYQDKLNKKGVIHSFTSGIELAKQALDWGFYLGFNGIITFKSAANVREIVEITPLDKILLETDAPFLTPTPFRGKENAPYYLPLVAQKVAEIKEVTTEEVLKQAYKNSHQLFGI